MIYNLYFLLGGIFLTFLFYLIYQRIRQRKSAFATWLEYDVTNKRKKKEQSEKSSFYERAHYVNWKVGRSYQQNVFILFTILGAVCAYVFHMPLMLLAGMVLGLYYPFYQLHKREDEFSNELPLRAEQAINAVEQQMQNDIPTFEALKKAVPHMQSPLRELYQEAVDRIERTNVSMEKALEHIPKKLQMKQLEYFHLILKVAEETEDKAAEIIRDCSDTLRRRQKHRIRYMNEVSSSITEMRLFLLLIIVMVIAYQLLLDPTVVPLAGTIFHHILNVLVIGVQIWVTWIYTKKLKARNVL